MWKDKRNRGKARTVKRQKKETLEVTREPEVGCQTMTGIEQNYAITLDMKDKLVRVCIGQWQEVGEQAACLFVRDEGEGANRRLKGAPVEAGRERGKRKRCENEDKAERITERMTEVCSAK